MDAATISAFVSDGILAATMIVFMGQAREMTRQSRATEKALLSDIYQSVTDNMLDIDRLFIDRPHLRKYFYENEPLPAEGELRDQLLAVAEFFLDFVDNHLTQSPHLPQTLSEPWDRYFRWVMSSSPPLQEYWRLYGGWYSPDMLTLFEQFPVEGPFRDEDPRPTAPPPLAAPRPGHGGSRQRASRIRGR